MKEIERNELRKKRNEEIKRHINQWKVSKLFKIEMEKMTIEQMQKKEKTLKAVQANKLIKQFQSQDDVYIQRKKILHLRDRARSEETIRPKITAPRDPERLLKPTKTWILKLKQDQESAKEVPVCSIRNIERLYAFLRTFALKSMFIFLGIFQNGEKEYFK